MKLDAKALRYMNSEEFRVLTAVEMGSKNHETVPTSLIAQISQLRHGGSHKILGELAKRKLVAKVKNSKYDGYRLTYGGYDYLALKTFVRRSTVYSVGNQIGVGKESDIYLVADEDDRQMVLKLQRLGRVSFRSIKSKRDYLQKRKSASWMYMSRLAAMKEYAFMKVLYENGFPVPEPIDLNRHCVVMELIDAFPLRQVDNIADPGKLYSDLMNLIVRLASYGLIHGDFNEFNILIKDDGVPILIDFPQMISTSHLNAEFYFNRDVECIRIFFRRRFGYESQLYPKFALNVNREFSLDIQVAASGFSKKLQQELEDYMIDVKENESNEENDEDEDEGKINANEEEANPNEGLKQDEKGLQQEEQEYDEIESEHNSESELESQLRGVALLSSSDSGSDSDSDLGQLNNRSYKAHRDTAPKSKPRKQILDETDIKERVAKALKTRSSKKGKNYSNRNQSKGKEKRKVREVVKFGSKKDATIFD